MFEKPSIHDQSKHTKNILLVKDEVGRAKPCLKDLPFEGHAYGFKARQEAPSAGEILFSWQTHHPSKDPNPRKNYRLINKMSITRKCMSPQERRELRNNADVYVNSPRRKLHLSKDGLEVVHGIRNKPGTPIKKVINNDFGNHATLKPLDTHHSIRVSYRHAQTHFSPRAVKKEVPEKELFKLKKFSNIQARVTAEPKKFYF